MFEPNLYTLSTPSGNYGTHRFGRPSDKEDIFLVKQHRCGDWQTIRKATPEEQEYMKKNGVAATKKPQNKEPEEA